MIGDETVADTLKQEEKRILYESCSERSLIEGENSKENTIHTIHDIVTRSSSLIVFNFEVSR